jgi:quercetin dioxygenase-like cupin family protein
MSEGLEHARSVEQATKYGRAFPLTVLPAGQEPDHPMGAIGVSFRLSGDQTNGQLAIVEHPFPVGALVPPHVHTCEDEFSIVTKGAIGFRSGSEEVVLEAGGYITKPRGELHTMWNAGPEEARMIEIITPAGFERYFAEVVAILENPPPGLAATDLNARYGLFVDLTWVPELVEKYHLNFPFG